MLTGLGLENGFHMHKCVSLYAYNNGYKCYAQCVMHGRYNFVFGIVDNVLCRVYILSVETSERGIFEFIFV